MSVEQTLDDRLGRLYYLARLGLRETFEILNYDEWVKAGFGRVWEQE